MTALGIVHLTSAFAAIGAGAAVLLVRPKGSRRHRQLGWAYVVSMLVLNGTALAIYRLFGTFGPFHYAALISLATIVAGTLVAREARRARMARDLKRRERLVSVHYRFTTFGYVGLLAAFASESITRIPMFRVLAGGPGLLFGLAVLGATLLVFAVGTWLIQTRLNAALAPFRSRQ